MISSVFKPCEKKFDIIMKTRNGQESVMYRNASLEKAEHIVRTLREQDARIGSECNMNITWCYVMREVKE